MKSQRINRGTRGNAIVETAFMLPWLFFMFIAVFDFGFYAYAAIATQNAARVAALYTASSIATSTDAIGACVYALGELNQLPNTRTLAPPCSTAPVVVTAVKLTSGTADGQPASQVSVTYTTVPLIPIPMLMGQMQLTRVVEMRIR